jgi:hypothetical protein
MFLNKKMNHIQSINHLMLVKHCYKFYEKYLKNWISLLEML